jgi:hypothetical protein
VRERIMSEDEERVSFFIYFLNAIMLTCFRHRKNINNNNNITA